MKNPNEQYIKEADEIYLQREETVHQYYSEYKTEWENVEALLKNSCNRPKNKEIFRNACIALLNFMRFDKVKETDSRIKMRLWGKFFNHNQNLIQKMFAPFREIKNSDLPTLPIRIKPPDNSEPLRDENIFAELAGGVKYDIDEPEYVIDTFLNDPIFADHFSRTHSVAKFSSKNRTRPLTKSALAKNLGLSQSSVINSNRPMGKFFHKHASEQKTKSPRLPIDEEFFGLVIECLRRAKSETAESLEIKTINDLKEILR